MIYRTLAMLSVLSFLVGCARREPVPLEPLEAATDSKYHPGEEYSFEGRPSDAQPRCFVLRVDAHKKLGNIVHLSLSGLKFKNNQAPGEYLDQIPLFSISEAALDRSHPKKLQSGVLVPDFKERYEKWRLPFQEGKAGIWTDPIAECLLAMERTHNRKP